LSKQQRYFYDAEAVREAGSTNPATLRRNRRADTNPPHGHKGTKAGLYGGPSTTTKGDYRGENVTRNGRSVWTIPSEPLALGHFAAFPSALARRCILAGSSAHGVCSAPGCGKPWVRVVERSFRPMTDRRPEKLAKGSGHKGIDRSRHDGMSPRGYSDTTTTGWIPTCTHDAPVVPATVLDPFVGSGTTVLAAYALGRRSVGLDLSWSYLSSIAQPRLVAARHAAQEHQAEQDAQPDLFAPPAPRWKQQPLFGATGERAE
jgi:hypothetical protein